VDSAHAPAVALDHFNDSLTVSKFIQLRLLKNPAAIQVGNLFAASCTRANQINERRTTRLAS
jgi:hypothetical protein